MTAVGCIRGSMQRISVHTHLLQRAVAESCLLHTRNKGAQGVVDSLYYNEESEVKTRKLRSANSQTNLVECDQQYSYGKGGR